MGGRVAHPGEHVPQVVVPGFGSLPGWSAANSGRERQRNAQHPEVPDNRSQLQNAPPARSAEYPFVDSAARSSLQCPACGGSVIRHSACRSAYSSFLRGTRDIVRDALAWSASAALLLIGGAVHAQSVPIPLPDSLIGHWRLVAEGFAKPYTFQIYGADRAADGTYDLNAGYGVEGQALAPIKAKASRSPEGWRLSFLAPWGSTLVATQAPSGVFQGAFHGTNRARAVTLAKLGDVPAAASSPDADETAMNGEEQEDLDPALARKSQAFLSAPLPASMDRDKLAALHVERSEAARRLGDMRTQIAELRQAYVLTQGRNYRVVSYLASATHLAGDWETALKLREDLLDRPLQPSQRLANTLTIAQYYTHVGQVKRAEKLVADIEPLVAQMGSPTGAGAWTHGQHQWTRGVMFFSQGRYAEAESALRAAVQHNTDAQRWKGATFSASDRTRLGLVDGLLASTLSAQGKLAEAEWILRDALARSVRETGRDSVPTSNLLVRLANVQLRHGRFALATKSAESAVATLEKRGVAPSSSMLLNALLYAGWGHTISADYGRAIPAFARRDANLAADPKAMQSRAGGGSVVWGYALIRSGRAEEALPMLKDHYELARAKSETGYATRERAGMYAYALNRAGRSEEAARLFAASISPLLEARRKARVADRVDALLESVANWIIEGYMEFLSTRASAGDAKAIGEMFRVADVARGSSVQRAVAQAASRATIREPALAELVRKEQDLANRAAALATIAEELAARPAGRQPRQVIASMRSDIQSIEVERASLKQEIAARFPGYAQLIEPQPVAVDQAQRLLRTGEVMLSLFTTHDRTYVWAIPQTGGVRFAQSRLGTADITEAVDKLRAALDVGDVSLERFPAYDVRLAHSLYEKLLKPLEEVWNGAHTLIVVSHGSLGRLPFATLPVSPPPSAVHSAGFSGYRDVAWLLRRIATIQLPSVAALASLRATERSTSAPSAFVGVGDPAFLAENVVSTGASRSVLLRNLAVRASGDPARPFTTAEFKRLPALPDTAQEVREIAAILKATDRDVLLGAQASETNVKRRKLDDYRVVMFATHGLVPGDFDGLTQPALALSNPEVTGETDSDGLLTLEEILGLKLNAEWVVLSACNTASPDGAGMEAVSGLGRAFFYAGARSLLVSNWPVETVSARLLTTDTFRRQARDPSLTRAEALRQSMLGLMATGAANDRSGNQQYTYAHPMFWAPFTLVGDASQ